jgi:hypothetical protein
MKKSIYFLLPALVLAFVMFASFGGDENSDYPSGAPAGYTGSPGDGKTCTQCHGGSSSNVTGWITSDIPVEGYAPGATYTITVTLTGSGKKGFEVSPQDAAGNLLGTLAAGTSNHLTGSGKYVTQNSGVNSNPATWSFSWTAPAAGTGDVTFYGAFTVSEPVTKLSTLTVSESTSLPLAVSATANPAAIFIGDATQLDALASGGSGAYTYSWTSDPAGFVSTEKNPQASPVVNTTYFVSCSDGVNSVTDSVDVTVTPHVGITGLEKNSLTCGPNPASGMVKVSFPAEGKVSLKLYDLRGTIVAEVMTEAVQGSCETAIDVSGLPAGVYILSVNTGTTAMTGRLIVI